MKEHATEKTKTKKAVSERPPRATKSDDREDASPAELVHGIEQTRAEMTDTLAAIERKLAPSELRAKAIEELEVVEEKVREVVKEQIQETKATVKAELREAKEAVKEEVREAFFEAKQALHEATIGKAKTMAKQASETMIETSDTFVDTVKRNPIPAAMVGIGLAWLFMNRSRGNTRRVQYREVGAAQRFYTVDSQGRPYDPSYDLSRGGVAESLSEAKDSAGRLIDRAQEKASHTVHDVRDAAGNLAHQIGDTASHAVDTVKSSANSAIDTVKTTATSAADTVKTTANDLAHRASDQAAHLKEYAGERAHFVADKSREGYHFVADKGREGYHMAEERFDNTLEENPLALGAVALAIGAAIGLAIPKTERENKLFGPYREQLFDTAREYAHEAVGQLHQYGEQAGEQVRGQLGAASKPSLSRSRVDAEAVQLAAGRLRRSMGSWRMDRVVSSSVGGASSDEKRTRRDGGEGRGRCHASSPSGSVGVSIVVSTIKNIETIAGKSETGALTLPRRVVLSVFRLSSPQSKNIEAIVGKGEKQRLRSSPLPSFPLSLFFRPTRSPVQGRRPSCSSFLRPFVVAVRPSESPQPEMGAMTRRSAWP